MYKLFILILFFYFLWITIKKYLPKSDIILKEKPFIEYIFVENNRQFNVFSIKFFQKINEIFHHRHTKWKKINEDLYVFKPNIELFKNFNCKFYKGKPYKNVKPNTLIYFPENNITWYDNMYLYNEENELYFFPKPNSFVCIDKKLTWKNDKDMFLIIGNKI